MIFDRTNLDVAEASRIREEKVKRFITLSESEIEILERGMLTIKTLNRIEAKGNELLQHFKESGIKVGNLTFKTWGETDIFTAGDFDRLLLNLQVLKDKFTEYSHTPKVPNVSYDYETLNEIELILFHLESLHQNMVDSFVCSGEIFTGEI